LNKEYIDNQNPQLPDTEKEVCNRIEKYLDDGDYESITVLENLCKDVVRIVLSRFRPDLFKE